MSASEIVLSIATQLVADPSCVTVRAEGPSHDSLVLLQVAEKDCGRIVGRRGKTAQAIRTLLSAYAAKSGEVARFDVRGG